MQFTALKDFWSDELDSQYVKGLSYTVRPPDKRLAKLVPKWTDEGKVTIDDESLKELNHQVEANAAMARVSGTGTVT